jgi:hypothetical protein
VDLKRVAIDTAKGEACRVSAGADTKANTWEVVRVPKQPTRATAGSNCP